VSHDGDVHVLAAPDKFRGTASSVEVATAVAHAVRDAGGTCREQPMADGGEGTLEALGGPNRESVVTGPLGEPTTAAWRLREGVAVIEMARASGLDLVGGAAGNDPMAASTAGTGELIAEAIESGATRVLIGVGGSATTDGGLGAIRALPSTARLRGVSLHVMCDVRTRFLDSARVFGPQKGASAAQIELLTRRLELLAQTYAEEHGVDVATMDRSGAAGGLAGGLAAHGAQLLSGFEAIADEVALYDAIEVADLVVTGEGRLDATSFDGKVVGGVAQLARAAGVPVLAVVGQSDDGFEADFEVIDLSAEFGAEAASTSTAACVTRAVADHLG
jgi:glycerate kinase